MTLSSLLPQAPGLYFSSLPPLPCVYSAYRTCLALISLWAPWVLGQYLIRLWFLTAFKPVPVDLGCVSEKKNSLANKLVNGWIYNYQRIHRKLCLWLDRIVFFLVLKLLFVSQRAALGRCCGNWGVATGSTKTDPGKRHCHESNLGTYLDNKG